jgi:hypothetical protein
MAKVGAKDSEGEKMTATREEINRWRAEDNLPPATDDTLARIFADWKPVFLQGQRIPQFDKEDSNERSS